MSVYINDAKVNKVFATLQADLSNYSTVLERLCASVLPAETATSTVTAAFQHGSHNPFRRVRAEFFEDPPRIMAEAFAPPDAMKMNALEEMKPCFLEGPRGTGKSMLLLALRARNLASRKGRNALLQTFGFYLKLSRGAVCNAGIAADAGCDPSGIGAADLAQVSEAFTQEILVCLLESLFSEIQVCLREGHIPCEKPVERALTAGVCAKIYGVAKQAVVGFDELLDRMSTTHSALAEFTRRRFIYGEHVPVPIAALDLDAIKSVLQLVKRTVPGLAQTVFIALLDEYENLFPFQQRVVNGFVKLAAPDFTVKIAKKLASHEVSGTTTGQDLQELHDYNRINLVYDVENPATFTAYASLFEKIVRKLLGSAGAPTVTLSELLPCAGALEVPQEDWLEEVAKLNKMTRDMFVSLPQPEQERLRQYYGEAAIYRALLGKGGRQKEKVFSGFGDLAFVSSGVIRYFLEFLGVAYYMRYGSDQSPCGQVAFPPEVQTQAVHTVSRHYLTTLSRNVEKDGEKLKYYVLDIGDCLRHKLLKHGSEPEAARLAIANPEVLDAPQFAELRRIIGVAIREGVFQTREGRPGFKPKHRSDPQPTELNMSRIYAPVLQISPRLRWRTTVSSEDLLGLLEPPTRGATKRLLMRKMTAASTDPHLDWRGTE